MSLDMFPQFLERTEITFFPFISSENEISDSDIALIEGCISEVNQIEVLKEIRKHSRKVYALGTCAAFGGILGLSKRKNSNPISKYIEINNIIPGCPPPTNLLGNSLMRLIENKNITLSEKNMCSSCPLRDEKHFNFNSQISKLSPTNSEITSNKRECFLNNEILCLGPITREGCDNKCIELGMPCEGCLGSPSKQFTSNLVNFLSLVHLSNNLKRYSGIFYRFSKPILKR